MISGIQQIHFVGIGGIGMSGIAELLMTKGYAVTGSDQKESSITTRLRTLGATVQIGHHANNIGNAELVVVSSAIASDNPEIVAARAKGIAVIPRAEMLAELMRLKVGIAVAGSHGKTTTTSLIATILVHAGLDPTMVVGGRLRQLRSSAKLGQGDYLVAEADESDGSFLRLSPTLAVVTNIDAEHLDYYRNLDAVHDAFVKFIERLPFYGLAVVCLDDRGVRTIVPRLTRRVLTYGVDSDAVLQARDINANQNRMRFSVYERGQALGIVDLALAGRHVVLNALAAIAIGRELNVPFPLISEALAKFGGIERRFDIKSMGEITIVDDYGHHPREIEATIQAAKEGFQKNIVAVFQPHRYTRTYHSFDGFVTAFNGCLRVIVLDIYSAGEAPIEGVSSQKLVDAIRARGDVAASYAVSFDDAVAQLKETMQSGDMVMTFGAGNVWQIADRLAGELRVYP